MNQELLQTKSKIALADLARDKSLRFANKYHAGYKSAIAKMVNAKEEIDRLKGTVLDAETVAEQLAFIDEIAG